MEECSKRRELERAEARARDQYNQEFGWDSTRRALDRATAELAWHVEQCPNCKAPQGESHG